MPETKPITFDMPSPIMDEEYIRLLRSNMLAMILRTENERAQFERDSINFQVRDAFLEIALGIVFMPEHGIV